VAGKVNKIIFLSEDVGLGNFFAASESPKELQVHQSAAADARAAFGRKFG